MKTSHWQFRPKLWPTLSSLILLPVLLGLGFWQLDRADQKKSLQERYEARNGGTAIRLNGAGKAALLDTTNMLWRQVILEGSYVPDKLFLLDNQTMHNSAGYLVYTPFRLRDSEYIVLVNRGWVPLGPDRARAPQLKTPVEMLTLHGMVKFPPVPGIVLDKAKNEILDNGYTRLQVLELDVLNYQPGGTLLPYVVRLEGDSEQGLLREWQKPGFGREKHLGYAFQWFAMSAALIVIFVVVNIKRNKQA